MIVPEFLSAGITRNYGVYRQFPYRKSFTDPLTAFHSGSVCPGHSSTIFLTVFAVRIVILPLTPEMAVLDHQFVF